MYVQVLPFYNICLLTYFHVKIFVGVHKAENVLHSFYEHSIFLGQHQYAYGFLISALYSACNMLEIVGSS